MEVDLPAEPKPSHSTSQTSPLPTRHSPLPTRQLLGHIMSYPTSAPSLRLALRQYLTDMEDVTALLDLIDEMSKRSVGKSLNITLADLSKTGKDPNKEKGMGKGGIPRLDLVSTISHRFRYPPILKCLNLLVYVDRFISLMCTGRHIAERSAISTCSSDSSQHMRPFGWATWVFGRYRKDSWFFGTLRPRPKTRFTT